MGLLLDLSLATQPLRMYGYVFLQISLVDRHQDDPSFLGYLDMHFCTRNLECSSRFEVHPPPQLTSDDGIYPVYLTSILPTAAETLPWDVLRNLVPEVHCTTDAEDRALSDFSYFRFIS